MTKDNDFLKNSRIFKRRILLKKIKAGLREIELIREGKSKSITLEELINEL